MKARVDTEVGRAKGDLRAAADAGDFESALAAASRLVPLEAVAEEVLRAGRRFGASHRSPAWYGVDAARV